MRGSCYPLGDSRRRRATGVVFEDDAKLVVNPADGSGRDPQRLDRLPDSVDVRDRSFLMHGNDRSQSTSEDRP